jgi:hypothetical protein
MNNSNPCDDSLIFKKATLKIRDKDYEFFLVMGDDDIAYYRTSDVIFLNKSILIKDDMPDPVVPEPTRTYVSLLPKKVFKQIVGHGDIGDLAPFLVSENDEERKLALYVAELLHTNLAGSKSSS